MSTQFDHSVLSLSPARRGAPDSIRARLSEILERPGDLAIASQQVSDRSLVDIMATSRALRRGRGRALIERDYLFERERIPPEEIWNATGAFEEHRQCFLALTRAGVEVRTDQVGGALQHTNFAISDGIGDDPDRAVLTSANFAPGSLDSHLNWMIDTDHPPLVEALGSVFRSCWTGDFRDVDGTYPFTSGPTAGTLVVGARGQVLESLDRHIAESRDVIEFAFFNISAKCPLVETLIAARDRGVRVRGIVDGDQGGQTWDAVPRLREHDIDARYYPGAITGGIGRMHYKMAAIDGTKLHLGTANLSSSAERSLELGLFFDAGAQQLVSMIQAEIGRLRPLARARPIPPVPIPG